MQPFYRRHPITMVLLRLAVSIGFGGWMLYSPTPGFDRAHMLMLAFGGGFAAAWVASFVTVWICEGWRVARATKFLEV